MKAIIFSSIFVSGLALTMLLGIAVSFAQTDAPPRVVAGRTFTMPAVDVMGNITGYMVEVQK
jgi:hypothetical protein